MKIVRINKTTTGVAITVKVNDEILPLFVKENTWKDIKEANGITTPDSMLKDAKLRITDYEIVRKGDKWVSDYRNEEGTYKEDKIRWSGNINIELDVASITSYTVNKTLMKLVAEGIEAKLKAKLDSAIDDLI